MNVSRTIIILTVALLATPSLADDPSKDAKIASLEARVEQLEKRIAAIEGRLAKVATTPSPVSNPQVAGVEQAKPADEPLVLDDWDYRFQKGDGDRFYYSITLKLRNAGAKQIKLIDASVSFSDILDQRIYGIKVSPDLTIVPGETLVDKGDYAVNEAITEQLRLKDMKKADVKARLEVRRIVFSDNTVLEIKP